MHQIRPNIPERLYIGREIDPPSQIFMAVRAVQNHGVKHGCANAFNCVISGLRLWRVHAQQPPKALSYSHLKDLVGALYSNGTMGIIDTDHRKIG
jgi:hypothetical protein